MRGLSSPSSVAAVAAVCMALLGAACADRPPQPGRASATLEAGAPAAYAVGRIQTVEDGQEKSHRPGLIPVNPFDVYLRSEATGEVERRGLVGDGSFVWPLAPGAYQIAGFQAYAPLRVGRIWARFVVPEAGKAAYVGTLRIEITGSGYRFAVEDRLAEAIASARAQLPAGTGDPVPALMAPEPPPGRAAGAWSICSERGGLPCDRSHQGVAVVRPAGAEQGFPLADSLAPQLEWRPAPGAGLRYDVVVYESIVLNPVPGFTRTLRGPQVGYAEGLAEPRWRVDPPLLPDRRHEWSVRLRDGDRVSTWSTTGHFAFFVVGFSSGYGQWFGLTTPKR